MTVTIGGDLIAPELTYVGHSLPRIDGKDKVTGLARFVADLQIPATLYAQLVTSPYAHANILKIEKEAALKVPGVIRVLTAQDLPLLTEANLSRKRNPLAADEVLFYGQPVAVVLAETLAAAEDGAAQVQVEYQPLPHVANITQALETNAPQAVLSYDAAKGNEANRFEFKQGDIEQAFNEADVIVQNKYTLPMVHQSYLETHSCLVAPDFFGGLTVYASTQAMFTAQREVAKALKLPLDKVKVVVPAIGGGFGGKTVLLEPLCAALALLVKRPVALSFSRMQDLAAANPMPDCTIELKLGAKKDGTLVALQGRAVFDTGAYPGTSPAWFAGFKLTDNFYNIPNFNVECLEVFTNRVGGGAYRAPGGPQYIFALESQLDMLAHTLKLDSLELRLKNLRPENPGLELVLNSLTSHPLWQKRLHKAPNEGFGFAFGNWATCMGAASATCRLDGDGDFSIVTGVADITGATTSLALIAAEVLQTNPAHIRILNVPSDSAPHVGASGGSQITFNLGGAVKKAAEDAREQILQIAAQSLEANALDLELSEGEVKVKGLAARNVTLIEIATKSVNDYEGKCAPVLGHGNVVFNEWPLTHFVHLAHVHVDPETGEVKVLDYLAVHDVGFAINPAELTGQIHGGVVQGLGWALFEQLVYAENGTLLSNSLMDYALPIAADVPAIQTKLVYQASKNGPYGAKGIGEPPIVPGAGAIGNAIFDAIGVRITELPATPERVLQQIQKQVIIETRSTL